MAAAPRKVVIFDIGGVIADSPIVAIRRFCTAAGLADLNPYLARSPGWDAFMRGKLKPAAFPRALHEESQAAGFADGVRLGVDGWRELLACMAYGGYRPLMIRALRRLREAGFTLVALTNNYDTEPLQDAGEQAKAEAEQAKFVALFDHFLESRLEGLSKPDRRFYELALERAGCKGEGAIFLDDIGKNVKAARALGIETILVRNDTETSFQDALRQLQALTAVKLLDGESRL